MRVCFNVVGSYSETGTHILLKSILIVFGLYIPFTDCHFPHGMSLAAAELPWGFFSLPSFGKKTQSKQFLLFDWIKLMTGMPSAWKVSLIWRGKVYSGIKKLPSLRTYWTQLVVFFRGAGSLISSAVDLNWWAGGFDYITYKRAGLSDLWGSSKSRKEPWVFSWSHHWWKGLSSCPCLFFFYSVTYCWSTVAVDWEEVEISSKQARPIREGVVASWCGHWLVESGCQFYRSKMSILLEYLNWSGSETNLLYQPDTGKGANFSMQTSSCASDKWL